MSDVLTTLKIIVIGSANVGKTCVLKRFCKNAFSDTEVTVGVDYLTKVFPYEGKQIQLSLWDTAGSERFHSLPRTYFRAVQGAVLVYDITNRKSFLDLPRWIDDLERFSANDNEPILIVLGNKFDLEDREVSKDEGSAFARKNRALFLETSAKTNSGVDEAFDNLVFKIMQTPNLWRAANDRDIVTVDADTNDTSSKCGGCFRWGYELFVKSTPDTGNTI